MSNYLKSPIRMNFEELSMAMKHNSYWRASIRDGDIYCSDEELRAAELFYRRLEKEKAKLKEASDVVQEQIKILGAEEVIAIQERAVKTDREIMEAKIAKKEALLQKEKEKERFSSLSTEEQLLEKLEAKQKIADDFDFSAADKEAAELQEKIDKKLS